MAVTQSHYRFGANEGTEANHGWYAAEDASPAPGGIAVNTTFLLRFTLQCNATGLNNVDAEFQYRKNGGGWTQITTSTSNVKAVTPSCWANAANTSQRLSGTGAFVLSSQGCTADGISGGNAFDIPSNGNGETECALQLVSADLAPGDLIEFRLTRDGGVLLDTYSVTPTLRMVGAVSRPRIVTGPFPFPRTTPEYFPPPVSADVTVGLSGVAATVVAGALGAALAVGITGSSVVAAGSVGSFAISLEIPPIIDRPRVVTGPFPFPKSTPAFPLETGDRSIALTGVQATGTLGFLQPPVPVFDKLPERGPFPFLTGSFFQFRDRPRAVIVDSTNVTLVLSSDALTGSLGTLAPGITVASSSPGPMAGAVGTLTPSADSVVALTGVLGTTGQGILTAAPVFALTGFGVAAELGSLAASAPGGVTLSGVRAVTSLGSLTVASETPPPVPGRGSYHRHIPGRGSAHTTIPGKGSIKMLTWNIDDDDDFFLGEDKVLGPFTVYQQNKRTLQDITGWAVSWMLKRSLADADVDALLTKTTGAGITLTTPTSGILNITIADTDTDSLTAGRYYHEVKRTDPGQETVLSTGMCVLKRGVHRS